MSELFSSAEFHIYLDEDLVAGIVLDGVQDTYPWYCGSLIEGPQLSKWRMFIDAYEAADLEFQYYPHCAESAPYDQSDLAAYVQELSELLNVRATVGKPEIEITPWVEPWMSTSPEELAEYIRFLDWRRWRVTSKSGYSMEGIPLPPALNFQTRRFAYRP